jgi:hypothetical protein
MLKVYTLKNHTNNLFDQESNQNYYKVIKVVLEVRSRLRSCFCRLSKSYLPIDGFLNSEKYLNALDPLVFSGSTVIAPNKSVHKSTTVTEWMSSRNTSSLLWPSGCRYFDVNLESIHQGT